MTMEPFWVCPARVNPAGAVIVCPVGATENWSSTANTHRPPAVAPVTAAGPRVVAGPVPDVDCGALPSRTATRPAGQENSDMTPRRFVPPVNATNVIPPGLAHPGSRHTATRPFAPPAFCAPSLIQPPGTPMSDWAFCAIVANKVVPALVPAPNVKVRVPVPEDPAGESWMCTN